MKNTIQLRTLDRKIWRKDALVKFLYESHARDADIIIDFNPEGSCATYLRLYELLDEFCAEVDYDKKRITIKTANMAEHHAEYTISHRPEYWYEIAKIQQWLVNKKLDIQYKPSKHFANFTSRSNWFRLWIATILDSQFSDKTIQTYHYDAEHENYNANGYIGVDDLFRYGCDVIPESINFLQSCPRTIDIEFLKDLSTTASSIYQHKDSYYPIQHPSNLNLLKHYNNIFVDIVVEPNISGNCFLVTEKLWRAIVAHRPFIVVSNRNYLRNLQLLGFKTFHGWWDESYDGYSEGDRIKKIQKILTDISLLSAEQLSQQLESMKSILEHNYQTFLTLRQERILRVATQPR